VTKELAKFAVLTIRQRIHRVDNDRPNAAPAAVPQHLIGILLPSLQIPFKRIASPPLTAAL
jgi:hypothetical protein